MMTQQQVYLFICFPFDKPNKRGERFDLDQFKRKLENVYIPNLLIHNRTSELLILKSMCFVRKRLQLGFERQSVTYEFDTKIKCTLDFSYSGSIRVDQIDGISIFHDDPKAKRNRLYYRSQWVVHPPVLIPPSPDFL